MSFVLGVAIGLFLTVMQTVYLPYLALLSNVYDLNISLIICFSLLRRFREALALSFFFGLLMDNLSGGPFGIYILSYIWIIIATKKISSYLEKDSLLIFFIVSASGVMIQNAFAFYSVSIVTGEYLFGISMLKIVLKQLAYAICFSPILLWLIYKFLRRFAELNQKFYNI